MLFVGFVGQTPRSRCRPFTLVEARTRPLGENVVCPRTGRRGAAHRAGFGTSARAFRRAQTTRNCTANLSGCARRLDHDWLRVMPEPEKLIPLHGGYRKL